MSAPYASDRNALFLSARLLEDWRWGRGTQEAVAAFRLDCPETGEEGLLNVFYTASELSSLVREHFGELHNAQQLFITYDNPQGGSVVRNADVVIWARTSVA
jgi:hypothetical protein